MEDGSFVYYPGRKYNEFSLPTPDDNTPKIHDLISNGKETLKNLKVYVPTEEYNSAMTFEQNLAEGKIKLMSELPVTDFNTKSDPIKECMTSSKMHEDFSNYIHHNNQEISDFDALVNPSLQNNQILKSEQQSSSTNLWDLNDNLSDTSQDGEKQHVCDVCDQKFSRRRDLALHYLTHSEKEKKRVTSKCDTCKKILKQCKCKKTARKRASNSLIEPDCISLPRPLGSNTVFIKAESVSGKSDVIKRELFHCSECTQVFGLLSQMKQHKLAHKRERARKDKEEKALTCNHCNKKCISKSELLYHKSTVHPNNTNVVSNQIYPLDSENLSCNDLEPQVCSSCRTVFNDMNGLQKHFKRLGWVCGMCSTYFCLKSDFSAHYLTHLDSVSYDGKNDEISANESLLVKANENSESVVFSCNKCSKKFKFLWMLKQHKLKHTLRKNKFCFRCKRNYKQKKNACIHFFSHGNSRRFECGECNKVFYEEKCLQVHLFRIH